MNETFHKVCRIKEFPPNTREPYRVTRQLCFIHQKIERNYFITSHKLANIEPIQVLMNIYIKIQKV